MVEFMSVSNSTGGWLATILGIQDERQHPDHACTISVCTDNLDRVQRAASPGNLAQIYIRGAQTSDLERNPVIVIPGILGSRLYADACDTLVWGSFCGRFANPESPVRSKNPSPLI